MVKAIRARHAILGRESMLLMLTISAGSVDAIGYLGLGHVFTAMMTGNIVLLGLALAQGEALAALRSIIALIGFAIGVFVGAIIVERESGPPEWPAAVTGALCLETFLLGIFGVISWVIGTRSGVIYLLIILLALAMGIQSAAVRRLGVPGIATTYMTGTLTTLMVDLLGWVRSIAAHLPVARSSEKGSAGRIPWDQRVGLLAAVITLYCFGALAGGILQVHSSSAFASLLPLAIISLVVANAVMRQRHRQL